MASLSPPPVDTTTTSALPFDAPSSSMIASRDGGKAPAVEAVVLGGVSSTRVLRLSRRTPSIGGSSSQPNPPKTEFEAPSDAGNEALSPFNADTYIPPVHIIGHGGSLRYRPSLSNVLPKVLHRESEQYFGFTNVKVYEWYERLPQGAKAVDALVGFELLILGFHLPKAELGLITMLVEQWIP
ncbi:hypothetical protein RHMOL_Rhmol11G0060900 [Rhododendron molle]|uniref:Uncharacterized protein n=1 Tax=Rhododendron molle TaxID=49168 RepID=A0ACC0LPH4_RHOML|nr:hypothetical protein RHMOL_Rhmol11G0060900 [Rhododendron molle]